MNISKERLNGYQQGLLECRLQIAPDLLEGCDLSAGKAMKATARLLDSGAKPDAIFGINGTVAFASMKEIKHRGLRNPDDLALVGFTDEFHATAVDPPLTSITHPTFEMSREAARLFFRQVENPGAPPVQTLRKTRQIVRESLVRKI